MNLRQALVSAGFECQFPEEESAPFVVATRPILLTKESAFSRMHGALTQSDGCYCWICLFPIAFGSQARKQHNDLWRSRDHVIPRSEGGGYAENNIRIAHRYCNTKRESESLTPELVEACRLYMIQRHLGWIGSAEYEKSSGLRPRIYSTFKLSWNHDDALNCRWGAD